MTNDPNKNDNVDVQYLIWDENADEYVFKIDTHENDYCATISYMQRSDDDKGSLLSKKPDHVLIIGGSKHVRLIAETLLKVADHLEEQGA